MPKQEGQPPFGDGELLYRRLIEKWIGDDGAVQPEAIEVPQCSVDRSLFTTAELSLERGNEHEIAVAEVLFCALPSSFDALPPAKTFELVVVAAPEPNNAAHTHLETRQAGEASVRRPGVLMKQKMRVAIAAKMRLALRRP